MRQRVKLPVFAKRFLLVAIVLCGLYGLVFALPAYLDSRAKARESNFTLLKSLLEEHKLLFEEFNAKASDDSITALDIANLSNNLKNSSEQLDKLLKSPDKRLDANTVALLRSIPANTGTFRQDYDDAYAIVGKAAVYYPKEDLNTSDEQKKIRAEAASNALKQIQDKLQGTPALTSSLQDSSDCFGRIADGSMDQTSVQGCIDNYETTRRQAVLYILAPYQSSDVDKVKQTIQTTLVTIQKLPSNR